MPQTNTKLTGDSSQLSACKKAVVVGTTVLQIFGAGILHELDLSQCQLELTTSQGSLQKVVITKTSP